MKKLPELEAWAIFAKIAETGSFARAATELSLSQATVSKAITRLEARMKTMLFHRTPRRIALTESGMAVLEHATRILEEGEALEAELAEQSGSMRGPVRIAAPTSFGLSHLVPLLPQFMKAHPEVSLNIEFSDEVVDLISNRLDMALRISDLADSSLLARRLYTVRLLLVGAPAYLERHGRPRHPRELADHSALQHAFCTSNVSWQFRHHLHGEFSQVISKSLHVNNAEALMPSLLAGLGLALQPEFLVWQDIQSGRLETLMDDWLVDPPIALHIVTPPGRKRPARVQAFIDYLAERFTSEPWSHEHGSTSSSLSSV